MTKRASHAAVRRRRIWHLVALALLFGGCSHQARAEPRPPVRDGSSQLANAFRLEPAGSLEARISASLEGMQIDVLGGGEPAPASGTTIYMLDHNWGTAAYWKGDGWCLARQYLWQVVKATSDTEFDVQYRVLKEYPDCVAPWGGDVMLHIDGVHHVAGQAVYSGMYGPPIGLATERTQCSDVWDEFSPCGLPGQVGFVPPPDL